MKPHLLMAALIPFVFIALPTPARAVAETDKDGTAIEGVCQERQKSEQPRATPESLLVEIESLRPAKIAWREIAWNPCLLAGLKESREQGKPVLLWIFIDRPADDARC